MRAAQTLEFVVVCRLRALAIGIDTPADASAPAVGDDVTERHVTELGRVDLAGHDEFVQLLHLPVGHPVMRHAASRRRGAAASFP
ncbi:hypothetical protein GCM10009645_18590 [Mycolicibacterium poriferae]|uniref:Uncharacterized protein n=2 Tax=Mycolicibacterium poriferae TaxID=39694 RepID=A0A6N4V9J1_9MYCO|nr:hypothetical protein MPOR_17140 [Mycolicibacterium poriferae]